MPRLSLLRGTNGNDPAAPRDVCRNRVVFRSKSLPKEDRGTAGTSVPVWGWRFRPGTGAGARSLIFHGPHLSRHRLRKRRRARDGTQPGWRVRRKRVEADCHHAWASGSIGQMMAHSFSGRVAAKNATTELLNGGCGSSKKHCEEHNGLV